MKKHSLKKLCALLACFVIPAMPVEGALSIDDSIDISGLIETEASYADIHSGDESDIVLATIELGIEAGISDWLSANVLLLYEEDGTDGIEVDEAFLNLTPGDSGVFLNAGRFAQGIGSFPSWMITDPLTLDLGETTQKSSLAVGWSNDAFEAMVSVYKGDVQITGEDHINTVVGSIGINGDSGVLMYQAGVSYTNNLADSDTLAEDFDGMSTGNLVGGYSGYVVAGSDTLQLSGEILAAAEAFSDGARAGKRPVAYTIEALWDAPSPLCFAIRYAGADDFDVDNQYGATISYGVRDGVALGAEYLRNECSDDTDEDRFTLQLAAAF